MFASRDLSPVEVAESSFGRIEALDAQVNSFCHIDTGASLAMAEASNALGWQASLCRR